MATSVAFSLGEVLPFLTDLPQPVKVANFCKKISKLIVLLLLKLKPLFFKDVTIDIDVEVPHSISHLSVKITSSMT
jgi:hypothetical protein